MKIKRFKKAIVFGLVLALLGMVLAGCGKKDDKAANTSGSQAKTKIVVGTAGMPNPFTYVNKDGVLEGYDIEVVKAIFEQLPQYEVTFEKTEFPSVLSGLDSDRYQVGANNFAMNAKRKEKYIYTDAIFKNQYVIAVAENNDSIKSFKDLLGKTTEVKPGINYTTALENYNKENPASPVKLTYSEAEMLPVLQNVESGKFDFQLIDKSMLNKFTSEYGLKLKVIELSKEDSDKIGVPYSYLLVSKGNDELAADINKALKEIIKNGKVSEISKKYFNGGDFAPEVK